MTRRHADELVLSRSLGDFYLVVIRLWYLLDLPRECMIRPFDLACDWPAPATVIVCVVLSMDTYCAFAQTKFFDFTFSRLMPKVLEC